MESLRPRGPGPRVVLCCDVDQQLIHSVRRFLLAVVPEAAANLKRLARRARRIEDAQMRHEALSSIALKDFHVHGGCILATFLPKAAARHYVELVATFETAVDYLDNLCDRMGSIDEVDFRALHESLLDAIRPDAPLRNYFRYRAADDGGYLRELVARSQRLFAQLPAYQMIAASVEEVTARYCELQSIKHLPAGEREKRCRATFGAIDSGMSWWEGAAACGSTMPTFALAFGAIRSCDAARARELYDAYFPWISCFHILLDYFIDQEEDRAHGELNFVASYGDRQSAREGIQRVAVQSLARARATSDSEHHEFAVRAMCGFYCTRKRVADQGLGADAAAIAAAVNIDLGEMPWRPSGNSVLGPLLSLYQRMIRV